MSDRVCGLSVSQGGVRRVSPSGGVADQVCKELNIMYSSSSSGSSVSTRVMTMKNRSKSAMMRLSKKVMACNGGTSMSERNMNELVWLGGGWEMEIGELRLCRCCLHRRHPVASLDSKP